MAGDAGVGMALDQMMQKYPNSVTVGGCWVTTFLTVGFFLKENLQGTSRAATDTVVPHP